MDRRRSGVLLAALVVALGGIIYELILGTVSSYLLGNSVLQFSITIGLFLFGMGIGSFLTAYIRRSAEETFILVETAIAMLGGNAPLILFASYAYTAVFYGIFCACVTVIGILIGFEIPTMLRLAAQKDGTLRYVSHILALDYLGALIASILFPLVLLPHLGIIRTAYAVGLLNMLIALGMYWSFRKDVRIRTILLLPCLCACFAVLSGGLIYSHFIASRLDHKLYQDEVIFSQQSSYQKIILTRFKDDIRLFLDGSIQFSSIDEYRYHEPLVHIPMHMARTQASILVLGGGDGLAVREILKYPHVERITLVDLDPAVTHLAQTHPTLLNINQRSLFDPKVTIVHADAFSFLHSGSVLFDVIIIDLPDPNNEQLAKLYSREFYRLIKRRLSEHGVFVTQATSPYFSSRTFWMINSTIQSEDLVTIPFHVNVPSFGEWGFILGSAYSIPKPSGITVSSTFLSDAILPSLFTFSKDLLVTSDGEENTLHNPIILQAYEEDARRWDP